MYEWHCLRGDTYMEKSVDDELSRRLYKKVGSRGARWAKYRQSCRKKNSALEANFFFNG